MFLLELNCAARPCDALGHQPPPPSDSTADPMAPEVTSTVYKTAQHKHHRLLLVASRHLKQMHPASWLYCARVYFALKTASRKCNTIIPELI